MPTLAPADDRLAAADPGIPGLADVLAPADLVQSLGVDVADAEIRYLRYKPGISLVAGLLLHHPGGGTSVAQALAVGARSAPKLAKLAHAGEGDDVGLGAVVDERRLVGLADATADRHLPGVPATVRDARQVRPLVYKPGRRWVARVDPHDGGPRVVKAHRPSGVAAVVARHAALAGLDVPHVLDVDARRGTVHTSWVPGTRLDALPTHATTGLRARIGAMLAEIHERPAPADLPPTGAAAAIARDLEESVDGVHAVVPGSAPAAREAADLLLPVLAGAAPGSRLVHGDLSADQVIVGPAPRSTGEGEPRVTILDLDRVRVDHPMTDLGSWFGAAVAAEPWRPVPEPEVLLAELLEGYAGAGGEVDPVRLRAECAAAVLRRAAEPFRHHRRDWPDAVATLVEVAHDLAVRGAAR